MPDLPDKRANAPFSCHIGGTVEALAALAHVRFDLMFRDVDAIATAWTVGTPLARELFGPDVDFGGPRCAGISYGHLSCLGAELRFPEDSEVAVLPLYPSLAEGVKALRRDVDFTHAGLFPFYLDLHQKLQKRFPDRTIPFSGFGVEGPITSAWLLRGQDFFMDLYDDPPLAREYLHLVTESVIRYQKTLGALNGRTTFPAPGAGIADDGAAMIPPTLWPEFVLPCLERYYSALSSGTRWIHIEDLTRDHLPFLDTLRIDSYDPSVSTKLTPALIRDHCHVPFYWRLNETEYDGRHTPHATEVWVYHAAVDSASGVGTSIWRNNATPAAAAMVAAFRRAGRRVQDLLASGCSRTDLSSHLPRE